MTPVQFIDNHKANPALTPTPGVQLASTCGRWKIVAVGVEIKRNGERWDVTKGATEWHLYEHDPPVLPGAPVPTGGTRRRLRWLRFKVPVQAGMAATVLAATPPTVDDVVGAVRAVGSYARRAAEARARIALSTGAARLIDAAHEVALWLRADLERSEDALLRD